MKVKLRSALSTTHGITAFVTVISILILLNRIVDNQFIEYVKQTQNIKLENIITDISHQYHDDWREFRIRQTGDRALKDGFVISVANAQGDIIFDIAKERESSPEELLSDISESMKSHYKNWVGKIITQERRLIHENRQIGTLFISYYTPFYFTSEDSKFINSIHEVITISIFLSIFFALILGLLISRSISIPILKTTKATREISKGNYDEHISETFKIIEINELALWINKLAKDLKEHELTRKRIVSDVSHELRTPLAAIQINLEGIVDGVLEPDEERLEGIYKEILRVNRLVGELTKLARYENGNMELNRRVFNLKETLDSIVYTLEPQANIKDIKIIVNKTNVEYYGDEDKIKQAIINLISNSIKYSNENGRIYIYLDFKKGSTILEIKDYGIGIPKENLKYIFERFYRADKSRDKSTGGFGIGLTITKEIVEAHSGTIQIESKVGKGTDVMISLPGGKIIR